MVDKCKSDYEDCIEASLKEMEGMVYRQEGPL
jgi:hypothetical protein